MDDRILAWAEAETNKAIKAIQRELRNMLRRRLRKAERKHKRSPRS